LHLKALTVPTDQKFEFLVYPPGTTLGPENISDSKISSLRQNGEPSNSESWNPLALESISSGESLLPRQHVEHSSLENWTYASIHSYDAVVLHPRDPLEEALVCPKSLVKKSDTERKELGMHSKAITIQNGDATSHASDFREAENSQENSIDWLGNEQGERQNLRRYCYAGRSMPRSTDSVEPRNNPTHDTTISSASDTRPTLTSNFGETINQIPDTMMSSNSNGLRPSASRVQAQSTSLTCDRCHWEFSRARNLKVHRVNSKCFHSI